MANRVSPPDPDTVAAGIVGLVDELSAGEAVFAKQFADRQAAHSARLAGVLERLRAKLGESDPKVVTLRRQVEARASLAAALKKTAARVSGRPRVAPGELAVFGRVLGPDLAPAPGLRVLLTGPGGKPRWPRQPPTTDEFGDFSLVLKPGEIKEPSGQLPPFSLQVEDGHGRPLYTSPAPVALQASRLAYREVVLEKPPPK